MTNDASMSAGSSPRQTNGWIANALCEMKPQVFPAPEVTLRLDLRCA